MAQEEALHPGPHQPGAPAAQPPGPAALPSPPPAALSGPHWLGAHPTRLPKLTSPYQHEHLLHEKPCHPSCSPAQMCHPPPLSINCVMTPGADCCLAAGALHCSRPQRAVAGIGGPGRLPVPVGRAHGTPNGYLAAGGACALCGLVPGCIDLPAGCSGRAQRVPGPHRYASMCIAGVVECGLTPQLFGGPVAPAWPRLD